MMFIQDRSNTIKTETISIILLQPKSYIWQQESLYLIFRIVKQTTIPLSMYSSFSTMKILVIGPIPEIDSFENIFSCMSMYQVYNDFYTSAMSLIYQLFKLVWFAEFARNAEEITNMVTKWTIIWMLQYCHYLDYIIASILDNR